MSLHLTVPYPSLLPLVSLPHVMVPVPLHSFVSGRAGNKPSPAADGSISLGDGLGGHAIPLQPCVPTGQKLLYKVVASQWICSHSKLWRVIKMVFYMFNLVNLWCGCLFVFDYRCCVHGWATVLTMRRSLNGTLVGKACSVKSCWHSHSSKRNSMKLWTSWTVQCPQA